MKSTLFPKIFQYPNIDWELLFLAKKYYELLGYKHVETPWFIPLSYSEETKPHNNNSFVLDKDFFNSQPNELVGSAEQGFIYLIDNKELLPGKYFSISPCFRAETYDENHYPWFMKLELINTQSFSDEDLNKTIQDSFNFFEQYSNGELDVVRLPDNSFDINLNDIEIGSYGIRNINNVNYIYGTGLALPRFSIAKK